MFGVFLLAVATITYVRLLRIWEHESSYPCIPGCISIDVHSCMLEVCLVTALCALCSASVLALPNLASLVLHSVRPQLIFRAPQPRIMSDVFTRDFVFVYLLSGRGVACDFCRVSLVTSVPVSLVTSQSLPLQNAAVSCSWLCTWRDSLSWPTHGFSAPRAVQLWDRKR